jgi:acetamidase/formamidase
VVELRPFLGVLGMPPPEPGVHSTTPPRRHGGNIDCKELVAGSTLYLPIPVDGALFSAGDGHARQGDGEVSGTAIECPAGARVTLDVRDDLPLEWPCARIDGAWLTFGFDEHLGRAAKIAVDGMIELMGREHGLAADDALALASVVVDLRVTQVVNEQLGVHAVLRDDAWH